MQQARSGVWILFAFLFVVPLPTYPDGIPFKEDRVEGEQTTVVKLTKGQIKILDSRPPDENGFSSESINLTAEQQALLQKEAGVSPSSILVLSLSYAKHTCTCELADIGIRFKPDQIEIPHYLLDRAKKK